MNIYADKFTIEMDNQECWDMACDIKSALLHTVKTHWVNHQNSWQKSEMRRLDRMKDFFKSLGRPDMYDGVFDEVHGIFKAWNEKQEKKKVV